MIEGTWYAVAAGLLSLLLCVLLSLLAVQNLCRGIWFLSYHFTLLPLLLSELLLLTTGLLLPALMFLSVEKQSVVERLRQE